MTLASFLSINLLKKINNFTIPILGVLFLFMGLNSDYIFFIIAKNINKTIIMWIFTLVKKYKQLTQLKLY